MTLRTLIELAVYITVSALVVASFAGVLAGTVDAFLTVWFTVEAFAWALILGLYALARLGDRLPEKHDQDEDMR